MESYKNGAMSRNREYEWIKTGCESLRLTLWIGANKQAGHLILFTFQLCNRTRAVGTRANATKGGATCSRSTLVSNVKSGHMTISDKAENKISFQDQDHSCKKPSCRCCSARRLDATFLGRGKSKITFKMGSRDQIYRCKRATSDCMWGHSKNCIKSSLLSSGRGEFVTSFNIQTKPESGARKRKGEAPRMEKPVTHVGGGLSSGVILQRFPELNWDDTPFHEGIEWFVPFYARIKQAAHKREMTMLAYELRPTWTVVLSATRMGTVDGEVGAAFYVSVLTDVDANRHYCACLCFNETVAITPTKPADETASKRSNWKG
ncbi:hypothetical protein MSG28_009120 [Choristoneura fumiferana]|uniref:Uncharacterized protein n=1 Tax=Choristoneura fumiferana TaxID=7141 RepID=A0ACC0KWZ4_CHOFU|nr:hypothetical protein MSG28_009120 [Choristoneura fumiferana]